ncbi:hypothetical protein [Candidatus Coxiella mudrowiae]|uniref:Uncharacterized protein n=1 Tax=Candidatus Coxiella mudrowiae TaxID=2054173 RepID=A0ABM5UTD7_9COXI|nr:hypothetical protein [Candidatus Coxiella mudrowiae]AKQ33200.1 hypothetical protein CleRT_01420 [Candidatus Coxiella mudrowiae]
MRFDNGCPENGPCTIPDRQTVAIVITTPYGNADGLVKIEDKNGVSCTYEHDNGTTGQCPWIIYDLSMTAVRLLLQ